MVDFKNEFGKKLKEYRKISELTQEQLAELVGIAVQTLSGFERGKVFPSYTVLCKLIDVLNISPEVLFTYDKYSSKPNNKEAQIKILQYFNNLDPLHQTIAENLLQSLTQTNKKQ